MFLRLIVLIFIIAACAAVAFGDDVSGLHPGTWDVSTLIPGKGSVPPSHELHVDSGEWSLVERNFSRASQLLSSAAARLGVIYAAVPQEETNLCHASPLLRMEWSATRGDDGFAIDCLAFDWLTASALRAFARDGHLHAHFNAPQPLLVRRGGACVSTEWTLLDVRVTRVSSESVVVSTALQDASSGVTVPCTSHFELTRRPVAVSQKGTSSSSSLYAPLSLLLVVVAVRLLPRYILTRTGQIDASSYRGRNPGKLTPARRAELLQKQRRIIAQMKAEDQANAPKKEKTS